MRILVWATACVSCAAAQLTIYGQSTSAAASATPSQVSLTPPANPTGLAATQTLPVSATVPANITGKTVYGNFMGWSIELSVVTDFLGTSSESLVSPFLNYLANQQYRSKRPLVVRIGGNTQDSSSIDLSQNKTIIKSNPPGAPNSYTGTPDVSFGVSLFQTMKAVGANVPTSWAFGLQLKNISKDANDRLVAEEAEAVLGSELLTLQIGNEPDLYASHGDRGVNYSIPNYVQEFGEVLTEVNGSSSVPAKKVFAGPSVCCQWTPDQVFQAGFLTDYRTSLNVLAVQHYPNNNCVATGKINGTIISPAGVLPEYLNHVYVSALTSSFNTSASAAAALGIQLIMMETNTASCGGFPGVSDSFAAALWAVDYCLSMAAVGFDNALFHTSGRSTYYNPFTSPASTSVSRDWTTGPIYYSALLVAEAFGTGARSVDLTQDNSRPTYAVYDNNGQLSRMVIVNYADGASGALTAVVPSSGSSVLVKYMSAPSTTAKTNITFAGQSYDRGDGLSSGSEVVDTVACAGGACSVTVPGASAALIFMSEAALSDAAPSATSTFAPPSQTSTVRPVPTVDPSALATSNGQGGAQQPFGYSGTGQGSRKLMSAASSHRPHHWSLPLAMFIVAPALLL